MGKLSWFLASKYEWETLLDGQLTVSITLTAKAEGLIFTHGMAECNHISSPYCSGFVIDCIPKDDIDPKAKIALVKKYQSLVDRLLC
jgi:hypothetical protein